MEVFVGHDWAEAHHDVFVMDADGARLGGGRLREGIEGVARFTSSSLRMSASPTR